MTRRIWNKDAIARLRGLLAQCDSELRVVTSEMERLQVDDFQGELDTVETRLIWCLQKLSVFSGKWAAYRRELIAQKARQLATELNQAHAAADPVAALDPISLREKVGSPPHADSPPATKPAPPATPVAKEKRRVKGMLRGQEKSREKKGASNVDEAT